MTDETGSLILMGLLIYYGGATGVVITITTVAFSTVSFSVFLLSIHILASPFDKVYSFSVYRLQQICPLIGVFLLRCYLSPVVPNGTSSSNENPCCNCSVLLVMRTCYNFTIHLEHWIRPHTIKIIKIKYRTCGT